MIDDTTNMLHRLTLAASFVMMVTGSYGAGLALSQGDYAYAAFFGVAVAIGVALILRTLLAWNRTS